MIDLLFGFVFGLGATMVVALAVIMFHLKYLQTDLRENRDILKAQIDEFDDITKRASQANQSLGEQLISMQDEITSIASRQNMLDNSIKMQGKHPSWKN